MKVAIVTGASRGIGRATAIKLAEKGYIVYGVYQNREDMAKSLTDAYPDIKMIKADVAQESDVKHIIDTVVSEQGKIDVLVNNAGINKWGRVEDFSITDFEKIMAVNVTAKFLLCKYAIPYLAKSNDGVIVNMSSRGGLSEYVFTEFLPYCITNAGINNFTVGLAKELESQKIRVNALIPTVTDTDRFKEAFTDEEKKEVIDAGKLGTAEEAADHIISLIEDKTKNGEILIDKRVFIGTRS